MCLLKMLSTTSIGGDVDSTQWLENIVCHHEQKLVLSIDVSPSNCQPLVVLVDVTLSNCHPQ
jgi:hypothetical protein